MKKRKIVLLILLALIALLLFTLYTCNRIIENNAQGKLYTSTEAIPYNKTGLLLGTAKFLKGGYINPYYRYRIQATLQLFASGKIKYVIISGDNRRLSYNEPAMMKADLISAGIDTSYIYLDYAGFRTFDSMVRVKEVFGQEEVTIISQRFHDERALYIAKKIGINACAYVAEDVSTKFGFRTQVREKFARVKTFVDFIISTKPKFLGEKINLPA